MVIGITGEMGSGKSTVAALIEGDFFIIDADKVGHGVVQNECFSELVECFGDTILDNGVISRKILGEIVFSDPQKLAVLNQITHPKILAKVHEEVGKHANCIIDAALLFQVGLDKICDKIIYVEAPIEVRLERLLKRTGLTEEQLKRRICAQSDIPRYKNKADVVWDNSGNIDSCDILYF